MKLRFDKHGGWILVDEQGKPLPIEGIVEFNVRVDRPVERTYGPDFGHSNLIPGRETYVVDLKIVVDEIQYNEESLPTVNAPASGFNGRPLRKIIIPESARRELLKQKER